MEENETLFSLELAVDSLCIDPRTVICRMPAVAFRLLDFPSIVVEQLDEAEADQLKRAIQTTWEYEENVPPQLKELKDRHGNHEFKKGKSSLYKYKLNDLVSHLDNTPLYIMIVDLWNAVPKLVAHCNVSLKEVVGRIKRDVLEVGMSVPSVHGIQGQFTIFNLMGTEIGWISLGVRLLSLGGNLIPHIADASPTKKAKIQENKHPNKHNNVTMTDRGENNDLLNLNPMHVPHSTRPHDQQSLETNHDIVSVGVDFACQTADDAKREMSEGFETTTGKKTQRPTKPSPEVFADNHRIKNQRAFMHAGLSNEENELYITNTHIPPPLIYNSENDVGVKKNERQRVSEFALQHHSLPHQPLTDASFSNVAALGHSSNFSSDVDDRKDLEVQYVIHPPEYHSSPNVRKILRNRKKGKSTVHDSSGMPSKSQTSVLEETPPKSCSAAGTRMQSEMQSVFTDNVAHLQQLPLLQALLRELSILNRREFDAPGNKFHGENQSNFPKESRKHYKGDGTDGKPLNKPPVHEKSKVPKSKPPNKKAYRHQHKDCAKPPTGVPASKGWLRQQPRYGSKQQKETKLKFKMTNSQKLRIQRHNPEAFRQLEEEERIAEIEFQMRAAAAMHAEKPKSKRMPSGPHPSEVMLPTLDDANISTEIIRHMDQEQPDIEAAEHDGTTFKKGMETFKIPTLEPVEEDVDEIPVMDDVYHNVEEEEASGSGSVRSISVHMPTTSVPAYEDDEEEDDDNEESSSDESQEELPKPVSVPGFPEEPQGEDKPVEPVTPTPRYSEDFEESYRYVSTGEQELADIRSSIDSRATPDERQEHSEEGTDTDQSQSSSYQTAESVHSARSAEGPLPSKVQNVPSKSSSSSTTSSRHPPSILSIPQPQMSANSPVPITRRSTAKSAIFNQPPKPKPRLSLDQTSSISNMSVLAPGLTMSNTLDSSEVNTSDLKPNLSDDEGQSDAYSEDFESDN